VQQSQPNLQEAALDALESLSDEDKLKVLDYIQSLTTITDEQEDTSK
jgi:hypothetical protein